MKKEIIVVTRGIEKFLIILALKPFLTRIDCNGLLGFVKKFIKYASARVTSVLVLMA